MSHYSEVEIELRDRAALLAALGRLGFAGKVEVHDTPQNLYGYEGDRRAQTAHLIIRRQNVGMASNDLGFIRGADGNYRAIISDFDGRHGYGAAWTGKLKQAYGVEKARAEAKKRGYRIKEETLPGGRVRLTLSGRAG
jgi:hypothetical protein